MIIGVVSAVTGGIVTDVINRNISCGGSSPHNPLFFPPSCDEIIKCISQNHACRDKDDVHSGRDKKQSTASFALDMHVSITILSTFIFSFMTSCV